MPRPGIMIYFDILGPIRVLPDADKGRLLVAMLEYGQTGKVPDFDGMLALAWGFVRPKIDKDEEEYNLSVQRRQFATACRERKKKGLPEITFEEWVKSMIDCEHHNKTSMVTNDHQWYPTTTTTPTTSTTTVTAADANTNTTGDAAAAANSKVGVIGGELGKGVVFLSDEQVEDLLDKMGLDVFNHYVDKLSRYILNTGAPIKNHYATILRWWREDSDLEVKL